MEQGMAWQRPTVSPRTVQAARAASSKTQVAISAALTAVAGTVRAEAAMGPVCRMCRIFAP
jgi:hypothetical protein